MSPAILLTETPTVCPVWTPGHDVPTTRPPPALPSRTPGPRVTVASDPRDPPVDEEPRLLPPSRRGSRRGARAEPRSIAHRRRRAPRCALPGTQPRSIRATAVPASPHTSPGCAGPSRAASSTRKVTPVVPGLIVY